MYVNGYFCVKAVRILLLFFWLHLLDNIWRCKMYEFATHIGLSGNITIWHSDYSALGLFSTKVDYSATGLFGPETIRHSDYLHLNHSLLGKKLSYQM